MAEKKERFESCRNGEDMRYLAYCATTGDYSSLVEGIIRPEYMSTAGSEIAQWLLQRRTEANVTWPLSYDALREMFAHVEWPDVPADVAGADPRFFGADVTYSYKTKKCAEIIGRSQQLMQMGLTDENYTVLSQRMEDDIRMLRGLGSPIARPARIGENPDEMMNIILGTGARRGMAASFELHLPQLNKMNAPFGPGMYCFFARPGDGKSWMLEYAAHHFGIRKGLRGVLVDQENDYATLLTRIACIEAQVDFETAQEVRRKWACEEPLFRDEEEVLDLLSTGISHINERSNIVLMGKETIDPSSYRISLDRIFEVAKEMDAHALFVEQIHKLDVSGLKRNDNDVSRIHRVAQVLADAPYVSIATTQEKRGDKGRDPTKMPNPSAEMVFGGDGVTQNCVFLCHVAKFDISDGSVINMLTPLKGRNMSPRHSGEVYIHARYSSRYEVMDAHAGRIQAESSLLAKKNERDSARKEAVSLSIAQRHHEDAVPNSTKAALPAAAGVDVSLNGTNPRAPLSISTFATRATRNPNYGDGSDE